MAHFSASGDSIASVFITIRIGFERCICMYLAAYVLLSPAICFCGCRKMLCSLSRLSVF